jgi:hypothetical protein
MHCDDFTKRFKETRASLFRNPVLHDPQEVLGIVIDLRHYRAATDNFRNRLACLDADSLHCTKRASLPRDVGYIFVEEG